MGALDDAVRGPRGVDAPAVEDAPLVDAPAAEAPAVDADARGRALLEALDRDGHVRQSWPVDAWPLSVGRALDNDVVVTDPHVAAHHLRIENGADAGLAIVAGDTRNGVGVGTRRLRGGERVELGAPGHDVDLVVGRTRLRLRLPGYAVAPEQLVSLLAAREQRRLPTLVGAIALLAAIAFGTWLDNDPANLNRALGNALLTSLAGAAIWCGTWALLSKTFTRQSHFGWHLRVFLVASLALLALGAIPPLAGFAFSWSWPSDYSFVGVYVVGAVAIYFHLLGVEPARERLLRAFAASGAIVGIALAIWFNVQRSGRAGDELYMNHLYPPALRLVKPRGVDAVVDGLAPLQADLDRKAREPASADGNDPHGKSDDDDE